VKYRIREGSYIDGRPWFIPEYRSCFVWMPVVRGHRGFSHLYSTLENAKEAIMHHREHAEKGVKVVWESE